MKLQQKSTEFTDDWPRVTGFIPEAMAGAVVKLMDDRGQEIEVLASKEGAFSFNRYDMAVGKGRKILAANYNLVVEAAPYRISFQLHGQSGYHIVLSEAAGP